MQEKEFIDQLSERLKATAQFSHADFNVYASKVTYAPSESRMLNVVEQDGKNRFMGQLQAHSNGIGLYVGPVSSVYLPLNAHNEHIRDVEREFPNLLFGVQKYKGIPSAGVDRSRSYPTTDMKTVEGYVNATPSSAVIVFGFVQRIHGCDRENPVVSNERQEPLFALFSDFEKITSIGKNLPLFKRNYGDTTNERVRKAKEIAERVVAGIGVGTSLDAAVDQVVERYSKFGKDANEGYRLLNL